jgi:hypothetical protein
MGFHYLWKILNQYFSKAKEQTLSAPDTRRLLGKRKVKIESSVSPLTFETTGGSSWKVWDRFIAVNKEKIYHIGNICGTCRFFFNRLMDSKEVWEPKQQIDKLNIGFSSVFDEEVDVFMKLMPNGIYEVLLLSVAPKFTEAGQVEDYFVKDQPALWGSDGYNGVPYSSQIPYYRGRDIAIGDDRKLFEFFIPLSSPECLDQNRVDFYKEQILMGYKPSSLSLTVLDIKTPAVWPDDDMKPEFTSHWCLAHYILDGHHKMKAASDLNSEITLLSFLATEQGLSSAKDINKLIQYIG